MAKFLVIMRSGEKFEMLEPDEDAVIATLHKRGFGVGAAKSIVQLDENGDPITLATPEPMIRPAPVTTESEPLQHVACPLCGNRMKIRKDLDTREPYWGCKAFPWCKGRRAYSDQEL